MKKYLIFSSDQEMNLDDACTGYVGVGRMSRNIPPGVGWLSKHYNKM